MKNYGDQNPHFSKTHLSEYPLVAGMEKEPDRTLSGEAINPPRLEDAGLEDCALPLESILEAFSKAASLSAFSRFSDPLDDVSDEEGDRPQVHPIQDVGDRSPVREVKGGGREGGNGTGGETVVTGTGEGGSEKDEKK